MSLIHQIYTAVPEEVKKEFASQVLYRVGNLIINENDHVQGFLQATAGFLEQEEVQKMVAITSQYVEMGMTSTNPVGLGMHAAGSFGVIAYQMVEIKNRLEAMGEQLNKINAKIDIGYYAKFKSAIELASHAFSMKNQENKRNMTHKAVQSFVEAKNIYIQYIEQELEQGGRMVGEYLYIVILAYIGQIKCYLELEELETAQKILEDNQLKIKELAQKYVSLLLSENPAIYLHSEFEDLDIDLEKLKEIYAWLGEEMTENELFKKLKKQYLEVHTQEEATIKQIPELVWNPILDIAPKEDDSYFKRLNPLTIFQNEDIKPFLKKRLQENVETIQNIQEAYNRFASITYEVNWLIREGMSYKDWQAQIQQNVTFDSDLLYISLANPMNYVK